MADNGLGIPVAEKPLATQRFYRCRGIADETGIGLGLSIVDAASRLHSGTFSRSENDPSLKAILCLPAASSDVA